MTFPLGVTRRGDPVKAYVTIIEGCNEFCSFCVVPYTRGHERMRPKADILAEVREAAASGPPRSAAARPDRQPLRGAGRSRRATSPACSRRFTTSTASSGSGSPARIRGTSTTRFLDAMRGCRRSAGTCTCRCSRARRACSRRCGGATRARAISTWSTRIRESLPDVALSTDMIVGFPGETDADFEDTLSLTAAVGYHSMFSFKYSPRPNTLADKRLRRRCAGGGEDAADRGAAGAAAGDSDGAERSDWSGGRSTCWSTRRAGGARPSCRAGRARTSSSTCRGRRRGSGGRCRCAIERAGPHSVWGRAS